jgi:hypothetical protein
MKEQTNNAAANPHNTLDRSFHRIRVIGPPQVAWLRAGDRSPNTIVETYPEDKYLPSYLGLARSVDESFHALFAADVEDDNVRVATAYRPSADEWESDLKTRKGKSS